MNKKFIPETLKNEAVGNIVIKLTKLDNHITTCLNFINGAIQNTADGTNDIITSTDANGKATLKIIHENLTALIFDANDLLNKVYKYRTDFFSELDDMH